MSTEHELVEPVLHHSLVGFVTRDKSCPIDARYELRKFMEDGLILDQNSV